MRKVYLVGALFSGYKESVVGVCPTTELAEQLANKVTNSWELEDCEITSEKFDNMCLDISWKDDVIAQLVEKYPEYSVSDIERAVKYYTTCPFLRSIIREVDEYACYDDILNYATDY